MSTIREVAAPRGPTVSENRETVDDVLREMGVGAGACASLCRSLKARIASALERERAEVLDLLVEIEMGGACCEDHWREVVRILRSWGVEPKGSTRDPGAD